MEGFMTDKVKTIMDYPYEVRERAAIYEADAGMSREDADARAIREYEESKANEQ